MNHQNPKNAWINLQKLDKINLLAYYNYMLLSLKQEEVLEEITHKLREHFDTGIIIIETETISNVDHSTFRTCGKTSAYIGLLELKRIELINMKDQ